MSDVALSRMSDVQITQSLAHYEAIIERGLKTFVEVGNALLAIREGKLYRHREGYATFEDYCSKRWGFARRTAYQYMDAAQAAENVRNCAQISPANEAQARPLTQLEPEQQRAVWQQAVETAPLGDNGKPRVTGAHVQRIVEQVASPNVHFSSETSEWYTPPEIVERAILVMGEIDLDPCSNSKESPNVPARRHFTINDDGLQWPWYGRVYMNPPYGREIADWVEFLCESYEGGNVSEAIALVPSRTDTVWFRRFRKYPRCFIWGRLKFSNHDNSAPFPSMVVYLGENTQAFVEAFGDIGDVYEAVRDAQF